MSARHSDKCTKEEASEFRNKVIAFLTAEKLPFSKVIVLTAYQGEARIHTGNTAHRLRLRMGRKLVAFKTPSGEIQGCDKGAMDMLKKGGDYVYQSTNEPIETKEYISMYRAEDWNDEKKSILQWFKEKKAA